MVEADKAQTLSQAYQELVRATNDEDHASVLEHSTLILQTDDGEKTLGARRAKLVSLIKKREFDQAMQFLGSHESTRKQC